MRTAGPGIAAVRCALGCYPAWWRQRYGAEQEELAGELAAEGRSCWLMAAGLAAGSVRARVTGSGMPPVAELWSRRACSSVVAGAVAAAVALPLELAFLGTVDSRSAGLSTWAALTQNGAGRVVRWELNALLLVWLIGAAQLLSAGSVLVRGLWALPSRRLTAAALAAAPLAAVVLGIVMIRAAGSLQPIVSGGEKNLVTGVTHLYYLRPGHPLAAAALRYGGWALVAGCWAAGLLALGPAAVRAGLPARYLQAAASRAQVTALWQAGLVLGLVALGMTMALQVPIGPDGLTYVSALGPLAVPVLVMLAANAALSVRAAACARQASAQWGQLRSQPADRT